MLIVTLPQNAASLHVSDHKVTYVGSLHKKNVY